MKFACIVRLGFVIGLGFLGVFLLASVGAF